MLSFTEYYRLLGLFESNVNISYFKSLFFSCVMQTGLKKIKDYHWSFKMTEPYKLHKARSVWACYFQMFGQELVFDPQRQTGLWCVGSCWHSSHLFQDNLTVKVKAWMELKCLMETWVKPCVSCSVLKTLSLSHITLSY